MLLLHLWPVISPPPSLHERGHGAEAESLRPSEKGQPLTSQALTENQRGTTGGVEKEQLWQWADLHVGSIPAGCLLLNTTTLFPHPEGGPVIVPPSQDCERMKQAHVQQAKHTSGLHSGHTPPLPCYKDSSPPTHAIPQVAAV